MKRAVVFAAAMAFALAAGAQQYKWVDKDGKVRYGDSPPPGVKATALKAPPAAAAASKPGAKDAKGAPKGPLTPAEQEAAFRKRQQEAVKEREKQAQATQETEAKKENCARAQEVLRSLQSGERVARTDAKGERYFLEDEQRAAEAAKAQKSVSEWCK
jgi:hypothetical protein